MLLFKLPRWIEDSQAEVLIGLADCDVGSLLQRGFRMNMDSFVVDLHTGVKNH